MQDPVFSPEEVGKIDAVLLSHDEHAGSFDWNHHDIKDNLDKGGRAFLPKSRVVITTFSGGKR